MKRKAKKLVAIVCAIGLLLAGCGAKEEKVSMGDFDFESYPMETTETLTYWCDIPSAVSTVYNNIGETEFAKELEKKTGVKVEYMHPAAGQETSSLNLMIASDELPDMVEANWLGHGGGAASSIEEGIILPLNDLIDQHAPNLKKFLQENPEIDKMVKTDDGTYYAFPFIRNDERLLISQGTLIRNDWLEELGLEMPETIDELEAVLVAFKEKKGATAPLSYRANKRNQFLGNFSTSSSFYLSEGKVVYGPLTENYKFAVETLKRWYDMGLLDPNFVSVDDATLTSNVLNGKTGVTANTGGGGLGTWLDSMKGSDWSMTGMPFTKISADKEVEYFPVDNAYPGYGSVAITTACKNPALAVRFLDYAYSEEGNILFNFGTENVSFEKTDDGYVFTDLIFNNPDGLTMAQAMANYFKSSTDGPFIQSVDYINQFYYRPQQQQALDAWTTNMSAVRENNLPPTSLTEDEASEYAEIMAEINKYESKMFTAFIMGTSSMDDYDDYLKNIEKMGIDRAIEIKEASLARYNAR